MPIPKGSRICTAQFLKTPVSPSGNTFLKAWHTVSQIRASSRLCVCDRCQSCWRSAWQTTGIIFGQNHAILHPLTTRQLGIPRRTGWHTFRRVLATALHQNGEGVKVIHELLRYSSTRITLDVYAQAITSEMRRALTKVVGDFAKEVRRT